MKNNQHNIFEVPLWGFVIRDQKHQNINYTEKILELEQDGYGVKKSNFGGFQTQDNLNTTEPIFKELVEILNDLSNRIAKEYKLRQQLEVTELWGNVNRYKDYNSAHIHSGVLSGVFYCKIPPESGKLIMCNPAVRSDAHPFRIENFPVVPQELGCIFFPSWLEHYVEPNQSDEPRISISFNIDIKK